VVEALDVAAGVSFLMAGVAAWALSRQSAVLLVTAGLGWFLGGLVDPLVLAHRPLMLHAALAYPTGRLPGRFAVVIVVIAWLLALVPALGTSSVAMLIQAALVAAFALSMRSGIGSSRSSLALRSVPALLLLAIALAVPPAMRLLQLAAPPNMGIAAYSACIASAGLILLIETIRRWRGWEADAVIDLSQSTPAEMINKLREEASRRGDSGARSLLAAAALLESNAALQIQLAKRVAEVRASRAQLVEAGARERERLGQLLADGPLHDLDELCDTVRALTQLCDGRALHLVENCRAEIARTTEDLAQLGRGLHPRVLTEDGLPGALTDLASHSPLPVVLDVPNDRFPTTAETAVWYACAELITNAVKHAQAKRIVVAVADQDGQLTAKVTDDGIGGSKISPGGGLAGLVDRLSAVGGGLTLESAMPGTQVRLWVPLR
jgi:signal transduction histidine kinase